MPSEPRIVETAKAAAAHILAEASKPGAGIVLTDEQRSVLSLTAHHDSALTTMGRMARGGRLSQRDREAMHNQAVVMLRAVGPLIVEMLFEKAAKGDACPYDAAVLKFLAKGTGIVTASKPVDDAERERQAKTAEEIAAMTTPDLIEDVLSAIRATKAAPPTG